MRYGLYLRERYRALLGYTGSVLAIIGVLHFIPLVIIPFYPEEAVYAFDFMVVAIPTTLTGVLLLKRLSPNEPLSLTLQEGSVVVSMVWVSAIMIAAVPIMLIGELNFHQAVFESTSGWTTTGFTMVNVEETPQILLFFRSLLQLAGGAGFAIIALSAISGSFSAGMISAEGRTDQFAPNVRYSARIVLFIYSSYVIFGIFALWLAGMNLFDAINHAFSAVSTGGFSTRAASIGYWDSPAIEAITIVLMILGTINFYIAYTLVRGKFRATIRSGEMRLMTLLLVVGSILMFTVVTAVLYPTEKAVRVAVFEITTALTTTGLSTVSYHTWPDFGWLLLILLMLVGGSTGSTAGGIKHLRIYILYKAVVWEVRKAFMPRHIVNEPAIWHGEKRELLTDSQVRQVALFIGLYIFVYLIGSGIMMMYGHSMDESFFEFASTLAGVGLSIGITSPDMPTPLLWVQSFGMLLGRLEFFTLIVGSIKLFSDSGRILQATWARHTR